jgi:hypothetical protein
MDIFPFSIGAVVDSFYHNYYNNMCIIFVTYTERPVEICYFMCVFVFTKVCFCTL